MIFLILEKILKIMNDNSIIDLNTTKNDIKILREKLYITIDSICEQKHDFYNIITSSLYYLEDIEKALTNIIKGKSNYLKRLNVFTYT